MSTCENCGTEFEQPNKYRQNKACSDECRYVLSARNGSGKLRGRRVTKSCPRCGTEFECTVAKPKTYCTWNCMMEARTEESRATRTCQVCEGEFTYFKRQDQRTCSPACRNKLTGAQREVNFPTCRTCGVSTESYNRVYCDDHRPSRPGRKPMPRRVATCQGCDGEFSRPGTWPGKMMFCSLECSNANHSSRRARHYQHSDWNLNGSYELRFAACLDRLIIPWKRWPNDDPFLYRTPDGKEHEYRPDFLVEGMAVETKGWAENPDSNQCYAYEQWNWPEPLVLVKRDDLAKLERIFNRNEFLKELKD